MTVALGLKAHSVSLGRDNGALVVSTRRRGVLFRDVLAQAATECALRLVGIPEKQLSPHTRLSRQVAGMGATVGHD